MEKEIFAIKFDKKIFIGYKQNQEMFLLKDKNKNSIFDSTIKIDNLEEIDIYEIIKSISEGFFISTRYLIKNEDEIYKIQFEKSKKEYLLDELLILFFEKLKALIYDSIKKNLKNAIIIYDNISYDLHLIIQRAAFLCQICVINNIKLYKAIIYFIKCKGIAPNSSISLIKITEKKIEISLFEKGNETLIFNSIENKPDFLKNKSLADELTEMKLEELKKTRDYIKNLINKINNNEEEEIDRIFIYENKAENILMNKIFIFGALYSNDFPISKESILIFNFIDYKDKYILKKLLINNHKYKINKKRIKILIDDNDMPFEDCYYKNMQLNLFDYINNIYFYIITIYFNQINIFNITKDLDNPYNTEMIFYKNIPNITINNIEFQIEEKFENNNIFKRFNIINVSRDQIKLNDNNLIYQDGTEFSNEDEVENEKSFNNILILIGYNLKVLYYFNKDISYKKMTIKEKQKENILKQLKYVNIFDKDYSFKNLENNKNKLAEMLTGFDYVRIKNYFNGINNNFNEKDLDILHNYGRFLIFSELFYRINPEYNKKSIIFKNDDIYYKKYVKIFKILDDFSNKIKEITDDKIMGEKLYFCICQILIDYLKINFDDKNNDSIFEVIDFTKEGIYKEANKNNIDLVLNLTKKSFLYSYFLQFNSAFKISQTIKYNKDKYKSCMVSMISLNQIKLDLIKCLPIFGIRVFFDTDFLADTILNTGITLYNEKKIFGKILSKEELLCKNDINYIKRVSLSFLQKHERFCHYFKILNKSECNYLDSPRGICIYEENKILVLTLAKKEESKLRAEIGESFEYIITNGHIKLIDNLFSLNLNIDLRKLFDIDIFLKQNNNQLMEELYKIENVLEKKEDIKENEEDNNKIEGNNTHNQINIFEKKKIINKNSTEIVEIDLSWKEKEKDSSENSEKDEDINEMKIRMINATPFRKYTFQKNTIQEFDVINRKFVPRKK